MPVGLDVVRGLVAGGETDAELIGRFADRRDEGAFALLVRRHGAMVFGVCRRLLPTEQDAEDAFQATFLVLAQKARTAAPREVGGWLHGVARRAALLARRSIARRRERVGDVPERPTTHSDELRAALDEELSRLPESYRTVVVLCDLEGRTRREAAALLGWPEGTVAGRLVRARELLAKRFAPAVSIAALLAGTSAARVPKVLAPDAAIPVGVAALAREVLGVLARGKLMKTAAVVFVLGCAGFGLALRAGEENAAAAQPPAPPAEKAKPAAPPARPAPDDTYAWGKEVGGLQAGIAFGDAKAFRIGEKVTPKVRIRNVGKAPVAYTYFHARFRFSTPRVTDPLGRRVPVTDPPHFFSFPTSKDDTLRAGESIDFGGAVLELAPQPDGHFHHAVRVEPGKYTLGFDGFVKSHPTLGTGIAEFEVKAAAVPPEPTAWGQEVGGVQAGLAFKGGKRAYRHGESATAVLRVRNVGKEAVAFPHIWAFFVENPPAVEAPDGRTFWFPKVAAEGLQRPRTTTVAPGKEADLHEWVIDLRPKGKGDPLRYTIHGTGNFQLRCERVVGPTSGNATHPNPAMAKLGTGKLEFDVLATDAAAE